MGLTQARASGMRRCTCWMLLNRYLGRVLAELDYKSSSTGAEVPAPLNAAHDRHALTSDQCATSLPFAVDVYTHPTPCVARRTQGCALLSEASCTASLVCSRTAARVAAMQVGKENLDVAGQRVCSATQTRQPDQMYVQGARSQSLGRAGKRVAVVASRA